jgi:hypothetical protein
MFSVKYLCDGCYCCLLAKDMPTKLTLYQLFPQKDVISPEEKISSGHTTLIYLIINDYLGKNSFMMFQNVSLVSTL